MKRFTWIDYLKAFGIVLVLLGHTKIHAPIVTKWIYHFHMPLFFFVSGFLLKPNYFESGFKEFFKKKILHLLVYFFVFALLSAPFYIALTQVGQHQLPLREAIYDRFFSIIIASGTPASESRLFPVVLWFFPALVNGMILLYFIQKYLRKYTIWGVGISMICSLILAPYALPWEIESGLSATFFLYFGYFIRKEIRIQEAIFRMPLVLAFILILLAAYLAHINGGFDFRTSNFGNPVLSFSASSLTIISFSVIFSRFPVVSPVEFLSRNTIYIFPTHPIIFIVIHAFLYRALDLKESNLTELVKCFAGLSVLLLCLYIWDKLPQMYRKLRRESDIVNNP